MVEDADGEGKRGEKKAGQHPRRTSGCWPGQGQARVNAPLASKLELSAGNAPDQSPRNGSACRLHVDRA
jgi:hypothetical protein